MQPGDDDEFSFDPKTWGTNDRRAPSPMPTATPHPNIAPPSPSFDPKTWAAAGSSGDEAPPPSTTAAARAASTPPRVGTLAAGACAAVLLTGAATAYLFRAAPSVPVATPIALPMAAPTTEPVNASRRTLVLAGADQVGPTLQASGVPARAASEAGRAALAALGHAPGDIRLVFDMVGADAARRLTRLEASRSDGAGLVLTVKPDGGFAQEVLQAKLTTQVKVVRGEMDATSFYNAAVTAGVNDTLVSDIAKAFAFDFNFATDVHAGDIFEAAFEQKVNPQGEAVGPPTLIYVSLSTPEKSKSLYRFLAPGDAEPGWYDGNGRSTVTALMRTPVDGARISSGFGWRFHPVLHFNKLHKGTDFAAPIGTPIYAAGTGTVVWAAMKGPNGNLTILQQDNGWQTYYLHQSMFMPGIVPGAHVTQGQKIGEIGTTGRSTGPHLHFELHVDGEPVDPMSIDTGTGKALDGAALAAFRQERDRIDRSRASPTT